MSLFQQKVIQIVRSIPEGKVMSYGQVAVYAGQPRAARQVGWTLHQLGEKEQMPWWRVINNAGKITIRGNYISEKEIQKKLLVAEGVVVSAQFTLPIEEYRFLPSPTLLASYNIIEKRTEEGSTT